MNILAEFYMKGESVMWDQFFEVKFIMKIAHNLNVKLILDILKLFFTRILKFIR